MIPKEIETSAIPKVNIQELIAEIDENFCFSFLSKTYEDILGYSQEELLNRNIQNIIHHADLGEVVRKITLGKEGANLSTNIARFLHKNGSYLFFQCKFHSYQNSNKQSMAVIVSNLIPDFDENRFSILYLSTTDKYNLFLITNPRGRIVHVNDPFCNVCKYTREELIGKNHRILNSEFHPKEFFREMHLTIQRGNIWKGEIKNRAKDGTVHWLDTIIMPVKDRDGKIIHFLEVRTDITEKKIHKSEKKEKDRLEQRIFELEKKEEKAKEVNQLLTTILDNTPALVVYLDSKFNFIHVNQAYAKSAKLSVSYFEGKNHFELYPHAENRKIFQRVVDTGEPFFVKAKPFEYPDQPERGTTYWDWSLIPIKDEKEKVKNLIFTLEEVTDKINAEKILEDARRLEQENTRKLQEAFLKVTQRQFAIDQHAIVAITNRAGTITYVNERFCEISQYSKEELLGENHRIINSGYHPKEFFMEMYSTIKKGNTWHGEIRNRAKDGSFYWVATTIVPLKNPEGKIEQYFSIRTVITKRVEAEEALRISEANMQAINHTKDKFFSIIAHDLRNPFAGIIGISEILNTKIKSLNSEEANRLLHFNQIILNTSKSSYSLLENLLFWAKTQTGDIRMNPTNLLFKFLISNAVSVVSINAIKKNIEIDLDLADDDIVYVDESSVNTILRNLITNAIKFTYPNGKVRVSTQRKENFLEISIADNGVGMDQKLLAKIFRIDSKTSMPGTENEQGTGLGLILCKELIQKQGGEIWVESQLGIGSMLTFTLPLGK